MSGYIGVDVAFVDHVTAVKNLRVICEQVGFECLNEVIHNIETYHVSYSNRAQTQGNWERALYMSRHQFRYTEMHLEGLIEVTYGLSAMHGDNLEITYSHAGPVTPKGEYVTRCDEIAQIIQAMKP